MKTIYKYQIPVDAGERRIGIEMPKGATPLHVGVADRGTGVEQAFLWALVDTTQPSESFPLWLALTGAPLPEGLGEHLGTAVMYDGSFVVHVFEGRPNPFQGSF